MRPEVNFISNRLKSYIDDRYDGNVNKALYYMEINNSTAAYNLYNGTATSVRFFLAARILKYTDPDQREQILADYFPNEMEDVRSIPNNREKVKSIAAEREKDIIDEISSKFATGVICKVHFFIYAWSLEHDGITYDDIASEFGRHGLQVADELLSAGVVEVSHGALKGTFADKNIRPSIESVRQHAHLHVDLFDDGPGHRIENPFGALNETGIRKLYAAIDEFIPKVLGIFRDPDNKGSTMYLMTLLGGLMSVQKSKELGR